MHRSLGVFSIFCLSIFVMGSGPVLAEAYEHGHEALQIWDDEGRENAPAWVKVWLNIMMVAFVSGLLFVWRHAEARWVVGGVIAGLMFTNYGVAALGVPKLSGLVSIGHVVFWSPGLYMLIRRRAFLRERTLFAFWSAAMICVILFSFVFDVPDALIYLNHIWMLA